MISSLSMTLPAIFFFVILNSILGCPSPDLNNDTIQFRKLAEVSNETLGLPTAIFNNTVLPREVVSGVSFLLILQTRQYEHFAKHITDTRLGNQFSFPRTSNREQQEDMYSCQVELTKSNINLKSSQFSQKMKEEQLTRELFVSQALNYFLGFLVFILISYSGSTVVDRCFSLVLKSELSFLVNTSLYSAVGVPPASTSESLSGKPENVPPETDSDTEFTYPPSDPSEEPETSPSEDSEISPCNNPETTPRDDPDTSPSEGPDTSPREDPKTTPFEGPETTPCEDPKTTPCEDPETTKTTPCEDPETTPCEEDPKTTPCEDPETTPCEEDPKTTPCEDPETTPCEDPKTTPCEGLETTCKDNGDPPSLPATDIINKMRSSSGSSSPHSGHFVLKTPPAPPQVLPPLPLNGQTLPPLPNKAPSKKLRLFNWKKIPNSKIIGTLWDPNCKPKTASSIALDIEELKNKFASKVKETVATTVVIKAAQIVDMKRAKNLGIILQSKFRNDSFHDLKKSILTCDDKLDSGKLQSLKQLIPTKEEIRLLEEFKGNTSSLSQLERWFLHIKDLSGTLESRLECMEYMQDFEDIVIDVLPFIQCAFTALTQINNSTKFMTVLNMILETGNIMNGGTTRGGAYGFSFESLETLKDTKGTDNNCSLLHFIWSQINRKENKKFRDWMGDLHSVPAAKTVSMELLRARLSVLLTGIQNIKVLLRNYQAIDETDGFESYAKNFIAVAVDRASMIEQEFKQLEREYQNFLKRWNSNESTLPLEKIFTTLDHFMAEYQSAGDEVREWDEKREYTSNAKKK